MMTVNDWEQLPLFDIDETELSDEDSQLNNAETNKDTNKGD